MRRRPADEDFEFDIDEPVFTTGVVTRLLGVPVWVLKQLDREEVVRPPRREEGCSRLYSRRDMVVLRRVWTYMKVKKLNVKSVKVVLEIESRSYRPKQA